MQLPIITKIQPNRITVLCCAILFFANIFMAGTFVPAAEGSPPAKQAVEKAAIKEDGKPAVAVNGIVLTQDDVDQQVNTLITSMQGRYPAAQLEAIKSDIRKKVIEDFVVRTLLSQESDKKNIVISENEVDQEINKIAKRLPKEMTLESALQRSGMSMQKLRDDVKFSLRTNKLLESSLTMDTVPSDEAIEEYYNKNKKQFATPETVHARHILLKVDDKEDEKIKNEKLAEIKTLRKQLLEGADFEKIAKEHSDCPSSAKGGDLGTFSRGKMVKPFEDAAFTQKVNDIGPVVETQFGYHIIKVLEHNPAVTKALEEVKNQIGEQLKQKKNQEMIQTHISELKSKADIVYGAAENKKNDS